MGGACPADNLEKRLVEGKPTTQELAECDSLRTEQHVIPGCRAAELSELIRQTIAQRFDHFGNSTQQGCQSVCAMKRALNLHTTCGSDGVEPPEFTSRQIERSCPRIISGTQSCHQAWVTNHLRLCAVEMVKRHTCVSR